MTRNSPFLGDKKLAFIFSIGAVVLFLGLLPEWLLAQTTTPATQVINFHTTPASLAAPGTGAAYQWQSARVDNESAWQNIPGAISSTFSPGVLDSTTCYRVKISTSDTSFYWARGVVSVLPLLEAGMVSPASQTISYDSVPAALTVVGVSGSDGNYSYQWYSSTDSVNWTAMPVITPQYLPGGMEQSTWYRVVVTSNGVTVTGLKAIVYVTPKE